MHWRAFVYDHRQDWRDRSTDRARAAHDHFAPLDGRFDDNVVLQVKHGPMDFQVREPVSPVLAAMPQTRLALELQVTQEYTGQQRHVSTSRRRGTRSWRSVPRGDAGATVAETLGGGFAAVSNVGDDEFWTGHPFAQANLYAFGRLGWDPTPTRPRCSTSGWRSRSRGGRRPGAAARRAGPLVAHVREYTAPLGVGWMVRPGHHYGPDVDGYEYTPWGTYHFADRDGIGVDRTVAPAPATPASTRRPGADLRVAASAAPTSCCCSSTTCRTRTCCTAGTP